MDRVIVFGGIETETQGLAETNQEINQMVFLYIVDLISTVFYPLLFKLLSHVLKILNRVVRINIIFLEILHKHQDEQIQHDVLLQEDENNEENDVEIWVK